VAESYLRHLWLISANNWRGITSPLPSPEFVKNNFGTPEAYEDFVMNYVPPEKTQKELRHYLFWD